MDSPPRSRSVAPRLPKFLVTSTFGVSIVHTVSLYEKCRENSPQLTPCNARDGGYGRKLTVLEGQIDTRGTSGSGAGHKIREKADDGLVVPFPWNPGHCKSGTLPDRSGSVSFRSRLHR